MAQHHLPLRLPVASLRAPQRFANKVVGQQQPRFGNERDWQPDNLRPELIALDLDANLSVLDTFKHTPETLAAATRLLQLDLGLIARPGLEIRKRARGRSMPGEDTSSA